jgi:putative membrane protein
MRLTPYEIFSEKELILRDHLAIDRTTLANERSFLAYTRTALTMVITGLSLIKFFDSFWSQISGWVFIVLGVLIGVFGAIRYLRFRKNINKVAIVSK